MEWIVASILKSAFIGLLLAGICSGSLGGSPSATFGIVGLGIWLSLPRLPENENLVTMVFAMLDIALMLTALRNDVRAPRRGDASHNQTILHRSPGGRAS
jgi:hypothetical protein